MKKFVKIKPDEITDNPFKLIGNDWMLITAGNNENFNTMTASWGTLGILWNKPVAIAYVRPTRYTYKFTETSDYFTLTYFHEEHRSILNFCGTKSGRNVDKIAETGLKPIESDLGNIYFEQARLVIECKKIYFDDIDNQLFLDNHIEKLYPKKDYHRFYIGEIVNVLKEIK